MRKPSILTKSAFKVLLPVTIGWGAVAVLESLSYIAIAFAILGVWPTYTVLLLGCVTIIMTILVSRSGFNVAVSLIDALYSEIINCMAHIKVRWFKAQNQTKLITLMGQHIPSFMAIPAHQLQQFIHAPLIPIVITIGMTWVAGYQVALILAGLLMIALYIQLISQRALLKSDQQRSGLEQKSKHAGQEFVDHIELLRSATGCINASKRAEEAWLAQSKALACTNKAAAKSTFYAVVAGALPCLGVLVYMLAAGVYSGEYVFVVMLLALRASFPMEALALAALSVNEHTSAIKSYFNVLEAPQLQEPINKQPKQLHNYNMRIDKLTYQPAFSCFSAEIESGTRVLIRRESGVGKSTLLHLLMGFDVPQSGSVQIGSTSLSSITSTQRETLFAYVPQSPVIFNGTIASNIRMSNPTASDEEVENIAQKMMLTNVISQSPLGINQPVVDGGGQLSGGEKQRIGLAQAILKKAPILILDEATAALDTETEAIIAKELMQLDCTIIVVSHRNPAIWQAHKTITLAN